MMASISVSTPGRAFGRGSFFCRFTILPTGRKIDLDETIL
jgi:hypothetical protein